MKHKHAATGAPRKSSGPGASTKGGTHMNRGTGGKAHKVADMFGGKGIGGLGPHRAGKKK